MASGSRMVGRQFGRTLSVVAEHHGCRMRMFGGATKRKQEGEKHQHFWLEEDKERRMQSIFGRRESGAECSSYCEQPLWIQDFQCTRHPVVHQSSASGVAACTDLAARDCGCLSWLDPFLRYIASHPLALHSSSTLHSLSSGRDDNYLLK